MYKQQGLAILALTLWLSGCSPQDEGAGGGGGLAGPLALNMVPHMLEGRGHVTYTPQGENVSVRIQAEGLPAPDTYAVWLIGPRQVQGMHDPVSVVASVPASGGRIDYTFTLPARELREWRGLELVHQPSGQPADYRQAHPALSASLPVAATEGRR